MPSREISLKKGDTPKTEKRSTKKWQQMWNFCLSRNIQNKIQ